MTKRESSLAQELGPTKYRQAVEKANKHYDDYKAGKRDPKTGEYYNPVSFTDPRVSKIKSGSVVGYMRCVTDSCDNWLEVRRTTRATICRKCKKMNSWTKEEIETLEADDAQE